MLFTRETDYALRFFRTLQDGKQHSVGDITLQEKVPQQFAYKILRKLAKAGMIKVTRGARGGCTLNCDLNETSLYDVVMAVESKSTFIACLSPDYECEYRSEHGGCIVHNNMYLLENALVGQLKNYSLHDILNNTEGALGLTPA